VAQFTLGRGISILTQDRLVRCANNVNSVEGTLLGAKQSKEDEYIQTSACTLLSTLLLNGFAESKHAVMATSLSVDFFVKAMANNKDSEVIQRQCVDSLVFIAKMKPLLFKSISSGNAIAAAVKKQISLEKSNEIVTEKGANLIRLVEAS
jgi:hypothetical protein